MGMNFVDPSSLGGGGAMKMGGGPSTGFSTSLSLSPASIVPTPATEPEHHLYPPGGGGARAVNPHKVDYNTGGSYSPSLMGYSPIGPAATGHISPTFGTPGKVIFNECEHF